MNVRAARWAIVSLLFASFLLQPGCDGQGNHRGVGKAAADSSLCPTGDAVEIGGVRRLAVIVGVGDYDAPAIPDLHGTVGDARNMYALLSDPDGYNFPKQNICLLLDKTATTEGFRTAVQKNLIDRARKDDVAVIFFAGHGSQSPDRNGDEPDDWDETLIFSDSRTNGIRDLLDDELNILLARLHKKTRNITLILDSCNSGTPTRGTGGILARYFTPDSGAGSDAASDEGGDGGEGYAPQELPGLVALTAATDGTSAIEIDGKGVFTEALTRVLSSASASGLTYAQVSRQVPPLMAASSYQVPHFQGDLNQAVFKSGGRVRPLGWDVTDPGGSRTKLSGTPHPGFGVGAELRVYDGAVTSEDASDPSKAKATVVVTSASGVDGEARIIARANKRTRLKRGDLAVLARPSDAFQKINVRIRPSSQAGGVATARAKALRAAIENHAEASLLVNLVDDSGAYEIAAHAGDTLALYGPENRLRKTFETESALANNLWQHARQRALLQLQGEGGKDFTDNVSLRASVVPAKTQLACARKDWPNAAPNEEQIVPLCAAWNLRIDLADDAPVPLLVGAAIMSSDGSTFGLPRDGRSILLRPGEHVVFNGARETFRASPPLDTQDRIMVFGTQQRNPVAWHLLTETAATRDAGVPRGVRSTLFRTLDAYLKPGTRGFEEVDESPDPSTWTLSSMAVRVEANQRFLQPEPDDDEIQAREYTIQNFNLAPYLPDDTSSSTFKVLKQADWLANAAAADGFPYTQHKWAEGSDEKNLRKGIDCTRAPWFAFTRAGVQYNNDDKYIWSGGMIGSKSRMNDNFDSCPIEGGFRLGDILVYRSTDPDRNDGHVVMVIDATKRIAWGSHGWDGEAKASGYTVKSDTGVEYQRIKVKKDWRRWDRSDMQLKACWRHRDFAKEYESRKGLPGLRAVSNVCRSDSCSL